MAVVIIGSAAVVSIGRLVAPHADLARPLVQNLLSTALDQPVRIRRIDASWPRMSPEIRLQGLEIGPEDEPLLQIDLARLQLRLYNLVRPARNTVGLAALGLDIVATQDESGRWSWQLEQGGRIARGWERALSAGDLTLRDVGIRIEPRDLPGFRIQVPEAALARDGDQVAVRLLASPVGMTGDPVEIALRLNLEDSRMLRLRGHAEFEELALSVADTVDASLRAGGQAWLNWSIEEGLDGRADLELERVLDQQVVERADVRLTARGADDQLRLGIEAGDPAEPETGAWLRRAAIGLSTDHWALVAERIELDRLQVWSTPLSDLLPGIPQQLTGSVHDLVLGGDRSGHLHAADGRIEGFQLGLSEPRLRASLDRATLSLAGDGLEVRPGGSLGLDWSDLFPEPVEFEVAEGSVMLRPSALGLDGLELRHPEVQLRAAGEVLWTGGEAFVDLVVDTPRISTETPQRWLPQRGLPPKTRAWLDRALVRVGRVEATTTLFGTPATWPRRLPTGGLNSRIVVEDLDLDYAPNWPRAEQVSGRLEFLGESLTARADGGQVAGVALTAPRFEIDQLREAVIELDLASADSTGAAELARLVRALPLCAAQPVMERMTWSGPAEASAELRIPVKRIREWTLTGRVGFDGAALVWPVPRYDLETIRGEVSFGRSGFGPSRVDAQRNGADLSIAVESSFQPRFRLALAGRWPLRAALPDDTGAAFSSLVEQTDGAADVQVIVLGEAPDSTGRDSGARGGSAAEIRVTSDLRGLALDWPAPLNKPAEAGWPFQLNVPLDGSPIRFELVDRVEGQWLRPSAEAGVGPRLGLGLGGTGHRFPASDQFEIIGEVPSLDLRGWINLLGDAERTTVGVNGFGPFLAGSVDVRVEELRFGQASLGAVAIVLGKESGDWHLGLDGSALAGGVRLPEAGAGSPPVVIDLDRLHWPNALSNDAEPGPPSRLDPRGLPEIDVRIEDLRYGDLDLGELSMNTHAAGRGLEIEQLSIEHPALGLTGSGRWQAAEGDGPPETLGRFRLTADSLGQVLADAGFDLALQRGQAVITLQGGWPGSPLDFTLQRFQGGLDLAIGDGVIPEARVGAGRLLGLVSLNSIPRRLRMDFTDVFSEGLTFDRVAGHFDLSEGLASTDDLVIEAPAAIVEVRGETDLAARTYDQTLIVQPGVGATLPIIGALTGGPIGAAAGAALQQLLDKPLRGVSEVQYSVTGPWDAPEIVPVSARGVEEPPAAVPDNSGP